MNNVSYDEYQYICPTQIAGYPGWTVLQIVEIDDVVSTQVQEPTQYGGTHWVSKQHIGKSARVLIGRKNEDALPTANAFLQVEKQMVSQLTRQIESSNKKNEEMSKNLEEKKKEYEESIARIEKYRIRDSDEIRKIRTANEKMEKDLGKVRVAIGDIKFKEIVGPL